MLKNASLRFLLDGGYRLPSQTLPVGYSENILPLIRKFCSAPMERFTNRKVNGEVRVQDAADTPLDDSGTNSEGSIWAMRNGLEKQGPKKLHETKAHNLAPRASQESHFHEKKLPDKAFQPRLLQVVLDTPANALRTVLDKWVEDGNCMETNDLQRVYSHLKKHRRHRKMLQFVEWIKSGELLKFEEHDYASHLYELARYKGIEAAQKYFEGVPKSFRNQVLYETLLASCVRLADVQKAEEVFQERNCSFPLNVSACNQMMSLYKRVAYKEIRVACKKVDHLLMLMKKENVKPSPFIYKLLIDLKGQSNDISGMDAVLDMMKANGVEPNGTTQTMIAKFYISVGLTEKAEEAIREIELHVNCKRRAARSLLDLYAILGRPDDIARIWKSFTEPKLRDYLAAIGAWSKLGHIEQAEETFETLLNTSPKLTCKYFNALLNVCAENKLLSKAKELLERMRSSGCPIGPLTWDEIVNLHVNSGEVKKAESFLLNEAERNPDRSPLFCSYIKLLKAYAEKGDTHNAENIFDRLKKVRYLGRTPPYGSLLEAYVNAKVPAYGFRERMRADKGHLSKTMTEKLNCLENMQNVGKT